MKIRQVGLWCLHLAMFGAATYDKKLTIKGEKYESEDCSESRQINFLPFGTAVGSPKITPYTVMFYATTVVALLLASTFGSTAMIGLTAYGALIASQDLIDMQLVLSGPVLSASSGDNIDGSAQVFVPCGTLCKARLALDEANAAFATAKAAKDKAAVVQSMARNDAINTEKVRINAENENASNLATIAAAEALMAWQEAKIALQKAVGAAEEAKAAVEAAAAEVAAAEAAAAEAAAAEANVGR